ncbi:hypothetical protein ACRALDRAFT_213526 [Sodiomyces alcalophilus JCM 7366]|uniref:uncharacterized protein n=1 Tax=Sodiomyces alcalophilus JCM 7366 TaxID=591952 RepID=UPI0039B6CB0D
MNCRGWDNQFKRVPTEIQARFTKLKRMNLHSRKLGDILRSSQSFTRLDMNIVETGLSPDARIRAVGRALTLGHGIHLLDGCSLERHMTLKYLVSFALFSLGDSVRFILQIALAFPGDGISRGQRDPN